MQFWRRSPSVERHLAREAVELKPYFPDTEQAFHLLQSMLAAESRYQQRLARRAPLTVRDDRDAVVHWIFASASQLKAMPSAAILAVRLLDNSWSYVQKIVAAEDCDIAGLLALTCLWIACKFVGTATLTLRELIKMKMLNEDFHENDYTVTAILDMEICICQILDWKFDLVTPDQIALALSVTAQMTSLNQAQQFLQTSCTILRLVLADEDMSQIPLASMAMAITAHVHTTMMVSKSKFIRFLLLCSSLEIDWQATLKCVQFLFKMEDRGFM